VRIFPAWIATEVMLELDPDRVSPHLVYVGCVYQLRQIARGILRDRFDPSDKPSQDDVPDLFPELQPRYPEAPHENARNEDPVYVRLEYLRAADVAFNVERMRRSARTLLKHADKLEKWWQDRSKAA
jgi:hypothetical protein